MSLKYCLPLVLPISALHNRWFIALIVLLHAAAAGVAGYALGDWWRAGLLSAIGVSLVWEIARLQRVGQPLELSIDGKSKTGLRVRRAGRETRLNVEILDYWRAGRMLLLLLQTPHGHCRLWFYPPADSEQAHRLRAWLHGRFRLGIDV